MGHISLAKNVICVDRMRQNDGSLAQHKKVDGTKGKVVFFSAVPFCGTIFSKYNTFHQFMM